jgi:hypothetical protein
MHRIPLESSVLAAVLYLPGCHELEVEFRSGKIYRYFGVPPQTYSEMLKASSKGRYFNTKIRDLFPFQQIGCLPSAQTGTV